MKLLSKELGLVRITTDEIPKKYLELGYSLALDADAIAPESRNLVNGIAQHLGIPVIWTHVTAPEMVILERLKKLV
jgi:predicted kinase